jgi:iron complex transport system permease protein
MKYVSDSIKLAYFEHIRHKALLLFLLSIGVLIVAFYALTKGSYQMNLQEFFLALTGNLEGPKRIVIANIRLPRIVSAIICGWGLSLSGLCIQSLLKNPLGSPSTLGISQGAAFGAALSIVIFGAEVFSVSFFAFSGAMAATLTILVLARLKSLSPEAIILAGVALSSLFASATLLIQYLATETELAMVVFWTFGDVARSNWQEIFLMTGTILLVSCYIISLKWELNAMSYGEETAKGLGVRVQRIRIIGMILSTLVAALATAFHGVIAFIGLIAPHIARRLVGENHGFLIPCSLLIGALLLLTADTLGRIIIGSGALPVGVLTSFLGAPMFLYLLVRGYK